MAERSLIYFASDLHLGMYSLEDSRVRENHFVKWLDEISADAKELWLLGDVFDYWFEYKKVVPRGFTRFLGKLASMSDEGIEIHIFTGNHDVWFFDYFPQEIGATIHRDIVTRTWNSHRFMLGHGDGLLKSDVNYRLLQSVFRNKPLQWLYTRIHPNASIAFAQWWSKQSRMKKGSFVPFLGKENEHHVRFSNEILEKEPDIEYFIFGHRHVPYWIELNSKSQVICLGDWIVNFTYAVFDGEQLHLKKFFEDRGTIITL
jgi:UDP-2,3-diacylglucosamine hydrolase